VVAPAQETPALPTVRTITPADLKDALAKGLDDFRAMPSHALLIGLIYSILGLLIARAMMGYAVVPLLFPIAAGFALVGPVAAVGLYEMSRQREEGQPVSLRSAFEVVYSPSFAGIVALGLLLAAMFLTWVALAHAIYVAAFGYGAPASIGDFLHDVFTTRQGWWLIVVGNFIGFLFAVAVLVISAVSFPLLVDRKVSAVAAMATSMRAFTANPRTMALWGLIVAALLLLGSVPLFFGLAVVMPVLGHATWHLYRKVVEPGAIPRPQLHLPSMEGRYAADFPASLFPWYREDKP
jgi:uncharacterized membrane protein